MPSDNLQIHELEERLKCPLKTYQEGDVSFIAPDQEHFKHAPNVYQPTKAPVFYNPRMELNRDLSILFLKSYQQLYGAKTLLFCEPLAGIGVRSIRVAKELAGFMTRANDWNDDSVELIRLNAKMNGVQAKVQETHLDANVFLNGFREENIRPDVIDVDPFGSPVQFADSTCRTIRRQDGLLGVTATDIPPLCGIKKDACLRKYGAYSLKTEYCHETAVRILTGFFIREASKYDFGLNLVFAWSLEHYTRAFYLTRNGKKAADESLSRLGFLLHCFKCAHRKMIQGLKPIVNPECDLCGSSMNSAGPLWTGDLYERSWVESMIKGLPDLKLGSKRKMRKILETVLEEIGGPATYHDLHVLCDQEDISVPKMVSVIGTLQERGLFASRTVFSPTSIRTDADRHTLVSIVKQLVETP